ncbi:hypothetical protein BN14_11246 [Rhizoctonia solani AG-1 IB]|uniref:Uncharacterized protein n=1 Tax=Thanatephorus cucumeris (strain AG1-IB / isolate 7/3/14) TaxID=1108050 RepID=M5CDA6_THACB|nr:hypothetical protein BN14_11246 [Rhizoctonia solani AG-1 IB]
MSLDINTLIILIVSVAFILEVLTVAVYILQNGWVFNKPSDVLRKFVPDAYNNTLASEDFNATKKPLSERVPDIVNLFRSMPEWKLRSPFKFKPGNSRLIFTSNPFSKMGAWFFSFMLTLVSKTGISEHTAQAPRPQVPEFTKTKSIPLTDTMRENDSATRRLKLKASPFLPSDFTLQGAKAQTLPSVSKSVSFGSTSTSNRISNQVRALANASAQVKGEGGLSSSGPPTELRASAQVTCGRTLSVATTSHNNNSRHKFTSTLVSKSLIKAARSILDKRLPTVAEAKEVHQAVPKYLRDVSVKTSTPVVRSKPVHSARRFDFGPTLVPLASPIVPLKRRLRAGANKVARPTKRRRISGPGDDMIVPLLNKTATDPKVKIPADTLLLFDCTNSSASITIPSPSLILPEDSTPATSTSNLNAPPSLGPKRKRAKLGITEAHEDTFEDQTTTNDKVLPEVVPETLYQQYKQVSPSPSHIQPHSLSPPESIVPAKRPVPATFGQASRTKRTCIVGPVQTTSIQLPPHDTFTPTTLRPHSSQQGPAPTFILPSTSNASPSGPSICTGQKATVQDLPTHAPHLRTCPAESTRGHSPTTTSLFDQTKAPLAGMQNLLTDASKSSSRKPGAPARASSWGSVTPGRGEPRDVEMVVLDVVATPDDTMGMFKLGRSAGSKGLSSMNPTAYRTNEDLEMEMEMEAEVVETPSIAAEDVDMDPDLLMDDEPHSGSVLGQGQLATMEDHPMAMEAVLGLENPAPLDDMDTAAISDEPTEDAEESMIQEDEGSAPAMVEDMAEPNGSLVGLTTPPQSPAGLAQIFAEMQVGHSSTSGVPDQPGPEMDSVNEPRAADLEAAPTQSSAPVTELIQSMGGMQVSSPHGEPNESLAAPTGQATDLVQSLAGMRVGSPVEPEASQPAALDSTATTTGPEEYAEDPFEELIQGLITTHLPAPEVIPYEPEATNIGVSSMVAGSTGTDFISLDLEDDEGESDSEGEEDEQALMDAAAAAAAWVSGL